MFKAVCLFSILVATSAFSTSYATQKSILLKAFEGKDQIGALPPIGYWDPLGLIANGPYGTPEQNFHHYRSVETKHGRIAGVAIVGLLTAEVSRFSGFLSPSENLKFEDMPNGLAGLAKVPPAGLAQIALFIGFHELFLCRQVEGSVPGDFGLGYFGIAMKEGEKKDKKLTIEVQNGRLAMLGILGAMAGEIQNGQILQEFHR